MGHIVTVHSFSRGVGKSTLTANLATLLAARGCHVAIIDLDIPLPSVHLFFGLEAVNYSLHDYLLGICEIEHAVHEVTPYPFKGRLFLIPASVELAEINHLVRYGYPAERLIEGFQRLIEMLDLDALLIDCQAGLNEATLPAIALANILLLVMRLDKRDYQGTGVAIDVAHKFAVPQVYLLANMVPATYTPQEVTTKLAQTYSDPILGTLPHAEEVMSLASSGIFVMRYADHALTKKFHTIADYLMPASARCGDPEG